MTHIQLAYTACAHTGWHTRRRQGMQSAPQTGVTHGAHVGVTFKGAQQQQKTHESCSHALCRDKQAQYCIVFGYESSYR